MTKEAQVDVTGTVKKITLLTIGAVGRLLPCCSLQHSCFAFRKDRSR